MSGRRTELKEFFPLFVETTPTTRNQKLLRTEKTVRTSIFLDDYNRSFPVEVNKQSDEKQCSKCGAIKDNLLKCGVSCGGLAVYCGKGCQIEHWRQVHTSECWKIAKSNTFTVPNREAGGPDVPVRALHQLDGFCKSGLALYYSNHLGGEATGPVVEQIFGDIGMPTLYDEGGIKIISNAMHSSTRSTSQVHSRKYPKILSPCPGQVTGP